MPRSPVARPTADARAVAHEVLLRVETTEAFADVLLADRLRRAALAPPDQALATRLVFGTLAWQGRLDHHLASLVRMPLHTLDPPVLAALRLGLYQLLFLDRVPPWAAVDGSVRLASGAGNRGAAGLVNAVLRRAARVGAAGLPLPPPDGDPIAWLAVRWSHPRWLVERWAAHFGFGDLPALLAADNERGPTAVWANIARITAEALAGELDAAGVASEPSTWVPGALRITRRAAVLRDLPAWREGRLAFQGEASQLVTLLLGAPVGGRVLDACAAPGGKATHMAALAGERTLVVTIDRHERGLRRLRDEAARLGVGTLRAAVGDARLPPSAVPFDAILVDAPCSGLGTLRRHPEVRWRRRPEDVARLAALQQEILDGVAPLVRAGGALVFAVCTLTEEENEAAVAAFLVRHPDFAVDPAGSHLPPAAAAAITSGGFLRTLPHRDDMDGFFAARLRRRD